LKSVNVIKIVKSPQIITSSVYDDNLSTIERNSFVDLQTLNFYLQTLPRKYKIKKGLVVVHDKEENSVDLFIADDDNSFFIN
jgi:hypothetical protein